MGKKKLEISYIQDARRRSSVFFNRRSGIFKKAHDLSKTCGTKISVILTDLKGNLHVYSNRHDIQLYLKSSVLDEVKSKKISIFSYNETDYPFNSLSHVGRESETFSEQDFPNRGIVAAGGLSKGLLDGDTVGGGGGMVLEEGDGVLGKRKRLKLLSNSLSNNIIPEESYPQPADNGFNNQNMNKNNMLRQRLEAKIQQFAQSPDFERGLKDSNSALTTGTTSVDKMMMMEEVETVRVPHKIYDSEKIHLRSFLKIIRSFENNDGRRVLELATHRTSLIHELSSFYDFISEKMTYSWDTFLVEYCCWRYLVLLYFSDSNELSNFSQLLKQVPLKEFRKFLNMRPPEEYISETCSDIGGSGSGSGGSEFGGSQGSSTMNYNINTMAPPRRNNQTGIHPSTFIAPNGTNMEEFYTRSYIEFVAKLKKYLEVFIQIILRKIAPGPEFNLTEEVKKVSVPSKSKIFKILILKKMLTVRSAWLINTLKRVKASPEDLELARKIKRAKAFNATIKESLDPRLIKELCLHSSKIGLLHYLRVHDLLIEKFFDDLCLYGTTQNIINQMESIVGTKKFIEQLLSGIVAQKIFKLSYNDGLDPQGEDGVNGTFVRIEEDKSVTESLLGAIKTPCGESAGFGALKGFKTPPVFSSGGDNESLLNFFDMDNNDNRSVMSFEVPSRYSGAN